MGQLVGSILTGATNTWESLLLRHRLGIFHSVILCHRSRGLTFITLITGRIILFNRAVATIQQIKARTVYISTFLFHNMQLLDKPLPVMVWIYGGSYSHGGSGRLDSDPSELEYDMALFARDTGTIVVTFNYRLNRTLSRNELAMRCAKYGDSSLLPAILGGYNMPTVVKSNNRNDGYYL